MYTIIGFCDLFGSPLFAKVPKIIFLGLSNGTKLSPNFLLHPVPLFELLSRVYWVIPTTT